MSPVKQRHLIRTAPVIAVVLTATAIACSEGAVPTATSSDSSLPTSMDVVPILVEPLTLRHTFTDDVAVQLRVKPEGRGTEVVNLNSGTHMAVVKFTVQPGVRFPWHSHPGVVLVDVVQGDLVFVYADDCEERPYPQGTAFVDPGFGNVHYAFNPTDGETIIVATFLGVPPAPAPLTNAVDDATSDALDAKCNVEAALAHTH